MNAIGNISYFNDDSIYGLTTLMYSELMEDAYANHKLDQCRLYAFRWSEYISSHLGIEFTRNWKVFKKNLVEHFFGKLPKIQLRKESNLIIVEKAFDSWNGRNIRYTILKKNSACHSESNRIATNTNIVEDINKLLDQIDDDDILEIFPESSSESSICFRRFSSEFNDSVFYEAGFGQAMYVFEKEKGLHEISNYTKVNNKYDFNSRVNCDLDDYLIDLIMNYDMYLLLNTYRICRILGIPFISIEGYYDFRRKEKPLIVDMDLPFDKFFFRG